MRFRRSTSDPGAPAPAAAFAYWRGLVLFIAGVYFLIPRLRRAQLLVRERCQPVLAVRGQSHPVPDRLLGRLLPVAAAAAVTTVLTMVLMVPTATYVHLKLPKMRRVLDFVTILPIVIPPIVLILGVLDAAPEWLRASPYLLSLVYVILALPFVYRSLDAGLSAIDLKTLVEASRLLGGRWIATLLHVILPNLRAAILSATVLTIALSWASSPWRAWTFGRPFRYGSTSSSRRTPTSATAVSMLSLFGTWLLLTVIVSVDRSQSRRARRRTGLL